jgi:hypothetical protein
MLTVIYAECCNIVHHAERCNKVHYAECCYVVYYNAHVPNSATIVDKVREPYPQCFEKF